jgi:hypothetical protein
MLSAPTVDDLATFTGRDSDTYSGFATQALAQATLLFTVITKLASYPSDPDQAQLARNAIMQAADLIYLEQPFAQARATPYSSETIGSYSYTKTAKALLKNAHNDQPTGLMWWDLAFEELAGRDRSLVASGSVSAFERTDMWTSGEDDNNHEQRYIFGPAELHHNDQYQDVNAEMWPRPGPR